MRVRVRVRVRVRGRVRVWVRGRVRVNINVNYMIARARGRVRRMPCGCRVCACARVLCVCACALVMSGLKVQISSLTACSASASGVDPTRARPVWDLRHRAGPWTGRRLPAPASHGVPERRCRDRRLVRSSEFKLRPADSTSLSLSSAEIRTGRGGPRWSKHLHFHALIQDILISSREQ